MKVAVYRGTTVTANWKKFGYHNISGIGQLYVALSEEFHYNIVLRSGPQSNEEVRVCRQGHGEGSHKPQGITDCEYRVLE